MSKSQCAGPIAHSRIRLGSAHLEALTIAHALVLLPPFHGGGRQEITRRPKAYAFDTGFVAPVSAPV